VKKKKKLNKELLDIKEELDRLGPSLDLGCPSMNLLHNIKKLEDRKQKILHIHEVTWRLKRRALWIQEEDRDTKFFHRYANHKRMVNTFWNIKDSNGNMVHAFP